MSTELLIVGRTGASDVGTHLVNAAKSLGVKAALIDSDGAWGGPRPLRTLSWRLLNHRPPKLRAFSRKVESAAKEIRPRFLIATGIAPLLPATLAELDRGRVRTGVFLTDDPWNKAHLAAHMIKALALFSWVFTPRRAGTDQMKALGCQNILKVPFAYAPEIHFPHPSTTPEICAKHRADVVFIGAADSDRIPYFSALAHRGIKLALYGNYWAKQRELRHYARGHIDPEGARKVVRCADVALCLVRRANRDEASMRSYEVPAMGGCSLMEDTPEHRDVFGREGEAVLYFRSPEEALSKTQWLLTNPDERSRLRKRARQIVTSGQHSYHDRLDVMLEAMRAA